MPGLFFDIRGFFDAKYSGQYLAILLRELARREPDNFARIFGLPKKISRAIRKGELQVEREWYFKANNRRRADLAILKGGEPILLLEVKEDDVKSPTNAAQLEDYLDYISSPGGSAGQDPCEVRFIHVSRFAPLDAEQDRLRDARSKGVLACERRYPTSMKPSGNRTGRSAK